jgi:hypothetical protein
MDLYRLSNTPMSLPTSAAATDAATQAQTNIENPPQGQAAACHGRQEHSRFQALVMGAGTVLLTRVYCQWTILNSDV